MNVPNFLTLLRIAIIPIFIIIFYLPFKWVNIVCALLFAFAAFTDWFDGYLARKLKQVSPFGTFFDPVADKLIVTLALVLLVGKHGSAVLALPAAIIIGREITVSALREWMAEIGLREQVAVSNLGKWKTALQMIAIFLLLLFNVNVNPTENAIAFFLVILGYVLIYVASLFTLWSMVIYFKAAWPSLKFKKMLDEVNHQR